MLSSRNGERHVNQEESDIQKETCPTTPTSPVRTENGRTDGRRTLLLSLRSLARWPPGARSVGWVGHVRAQCSGGNNLSNKEEKDGGRKEGEKAASAAAAAAVSKGRNSQFKAGHSLHSLPLSKWHNEHFVCPLHFRGGSSERARTDRGRTRTDGRGRTDADGPVDLTMTRWAEVHRGRERLPEGCRTSFNYGGSSARKGISFCTPLRWLHETGKLSTGQVDIRVSR